MDNHYRPFADVGQACEVPAGGSLTNSDNIVFGGLPTSAALRGAAQKPALLT
jgi:hypothetical protein